MDFTLTDIPETLLLPLHARAQQTVSGNPILTDPLAVAIIEKLKYDFSAIKGTFNPNHNFIWVVRARQLDRLTTDFAQQHPRCVVVNLGAGLDTTFPRVDNGTLRWFDLDLPEVIDLRRQLIAETERSRYIARSLFDYEWIDDIGDTSNGVFVLAAGGFFYFEEHELKPFFATLHRRLPGAHVAFDAMSPVAVRKTNEMLKKARMECAVLKWDLKDARVMESWDAGIAVVSQMPYFRGIPRAGSLSRQLMMIINDRFNLTTIVHCTV